MKEIRQISKLIEKLPYKDKLILSLYFTEELSFREIEYILEMDKKEIEERFEKIISKIKKDIEYEQPYKVGKNS